MLHDFGRFSMSIALGYYALEILLKVKICGCLDVDELPKLLHTHDIKLLLMFSGLQRRLLADPMIVKRWAKLEEYKGRVDLLRYGQEQAAKRDSIKFHRALWANPADDWSPSTFGVIPWISRQP